MQTRLLALPLLLAACERDFAIDDNTRIVGADNPPSLAVPTKTDIITQVNPPKVDVLWVIDNSGSMSDKQRKLANEFSSFAQFFEDSGIDWHMGIITTDMDDTTHQGRLIGARQIRFLTPETDDWQEAFGAMARVGDGGSGSERGRDAIMAALTDPLASGANRDFYRDEASLNIVVISDENDDSEDVSLNEFTTFLQNLKPDPEQVRFSAIVPLTFFGCFTSPEPAGQYLQVVEAVGGLTESICAQDWTPMLEELGLQAAGVKQEFFLSERPVPETIDVLVKDNQVPHVGINLTSLRGDTTVDEACEAAHCFGYTYDEFRNSVVFDGFVPPFEAKVHITYDLLSGVQFVEPE